MFRFVLQRMWNRKWMVAGLLIGNLLMVAIAAAAPMYSQAIMQRVLTRNLSDSLAETNKYPGTIRLESGYRKASLNSSNVKLDEDFPLEKVLEEMDADVLYRITYSYKESVQAKPQIVVEGESDELLMRLVSYSDFEDHIQIVRGELFSDSLNSNTFDVLVNEKTFVTNSLVLGEEVELTGIKDEQGNPYCVRISGIFESSSDEDLYWTSDPEGWSKVFVMDDQLMEELFLGKGLGFSRTWFAILDYEAFEPDQAERYLETVVSNRKFFKDLKSEGLTANFEKVLEAFVPEAQKLNTTLWVLQVPVFILLAAFIFMVSRQLLEMEQNEIAVYKSRGANKGQIISIYLLQSLIISILGMAGGILLGMFVCRILGASNSFLSFVSRAALPVKIEPLVILLTACAALFSVCAMVLPVFKYADVDIVSHKRKKNRKTKKVWWQLVFLDVILLAVSIYGLIQYRGQQEFLAQQVLEGASLDPLLYFCSSIFMIGAALIFLRIFPWIIKIVYKAGSRWWPPSAYASFLRILRTQSNQGFILVFMILTVAMGIFSAQAARTINTNGEERIRYGIGADIVLQEVWDTNGASSLDSGMAASGMGEASSGSGDMIYREPDFGKYLEMEEVVSATKVLVDTDVTMFVDGGKLTDITLMGIHTKEFGETAWFKESLLNTHWYEYLNAMSRNSRAILVSDNFREIYGYEIGDVLSYKNDSGDAIKGIIYGFVDYWPSYSPVIRIKGTDGLYREKDNFLIVAHLSQLQSAWGVTPYQVWIKTNGSSQFMYEYAESQQMKFAVFNDCAAELVSLKNEPVFQGTNGVLTIGFICVLLLCTVGFLIYWILSIRSRTLQFGIFRAMGMSMREILNMLVLEQFFLTGGAIAAGALVGRIASELYVPLIMIAYSTADQVIPLEIVSLSSDYVRLFTVIGFVILLCMIILGVLISKIKISQALKLGED